MSGNPLSDHAKHSAIALDDRYAQDGGLVFLSGIQALVRLPLMQRWRDKAEGLDTAGFISGYRGSPLGTYDNALSSAGDHLERESIQFQPGVNEDLAAAAVWGTQQINLFGTGTVDGVFAIWYGKGPGVDRAMDVLRHANSAGSAPHGGVLLICGDDHGAQSSSLAHQSDYVLRAAMIPVLCPANLQEYLDYGLLGIAMSRFSGCVIAFKAVTEIVETSGTVDGDPHRLQISTPDDAGAPDDVHIRWPDPVRDQETRLERKLQAVIQFAAANRLDRTVFKGVGARLGIVTSGKAYADVRQALDLLGLDERRCVELGIALFKVAMSWPLEPAGAEAFAHDLNEILVVEEKGPLIEDQLARLLYGNPAAPRLCGKHDGQGKLLPSDGELDPDLVARAIIRRLRPLIADEAVIDAIESTISEREFQSVGPSPVVRSPYFCSGCPHNRSTMVPDGSRALGGIGCHAMALGIPERRTALVTHMGGEGANWIGQAPFVSDTHIFQNLGDGTYFHSGSMAIRAAIAAKANITYKILFNDAVAMTGGQAIDGNLTIGALVRQLLAEGVETIRVVGEDPLKPELHDLPAAARIHHRDDLDTVQCELRDIAGVSVLIYVQVCAAEKRRRRKRRTMVDPPRRLFINDAVCEGCGDCSVKSNCVSVLPLETKLGRKRQIDQSNCNKDFSCLDGFCPSFVSLDRAVPRGRGLVPAADERPAPAIPLPEVAPSDIPYGILLSGIGGTGIVTVGALLGMAAHLDGKACTLLDITGLAQKNGAVLSHVRIANDRELLHGARIRRLDARLLLGCDVAVAAETRALDLLDPQCCKAVVNRHVQPTAAFIQDGTIDFQLQAQLDRIERTVGTGNMTSFDATKRAIELAGDAIAANLFLLGHAFQRGLVPLSHDALTRAIELNGIAVDANKRAFEWGRRSVIDDEKPGSQPGTRAQVPCGRSQQDDGDETYRIAFLEAYQDKAYAEQYRTFTEFVRSRERAATGGFVLTKIVAASLFKLMTYKDEYEVARLFTDPSFKVKLEAQFEGDVRSLHYHFAAPLFSRRDKRTGQLIKRRYGRWIEPILRLLSKLRFLRGSLLDVFGYTHERRTERRSIKQYRQMVERLTAELTPANLQIALALATLPQSVKGYGHIKQRARDAMIVKQASLLAQFDDLAA